MNEKTLEQLVQGEVLLTQVRKLHNEDSKSTGSDYLVQIECAEYIDNPFRPKSLLSVLHEDDSRFVGNKPRFGWTTMTPKAWTKYFGHLADIKTIEALKFSSTTRKDVDSPADWVEGTHFITINALNPSIKIGSEVKRFHVVITETLAQRNGAQPAKLNPKSNDVQTVGKAPIYSTGTVEYEPMPSVFLFSDQMQQAVQEGRLKVDPQVLREYNERIKAMNPSTPAVETPVVPATPAPKEPVVDKFRDA